MNTRQDAKSVSSIEQQLGAIQLSPRQRDEVRHAVCVAELISDAIVWTCNSVQRLGFGGFVKTSPKY